MKSIVNEANDPNKLKDFPKGGGCLIRDQNRHFTNDQTF